MITHKDYCTICKTKEGKLFSYNKSVLASGNIIFYKMCRPCNAQRKRRWYHDGNQQKAMVYNRRYRIRKEMNQ